jgi:1H-pyrrole-2-carbonyl-[peptidyl-carrier protein] brominase
MKTQVAIVGGGPGGSSSSMFLAKEGIQSVIIEQETFPRYHVGESMTGECGGVVRELGLENEMLKRKHPIKHGVRVFGTSGKNAWFVPVMMRTPEWELKDQFTWQVRRSDFDKMMLEEAVNRGATLIRGRALKPLIGEDGSVKGVQVRMADGDVQTIESEMLLDCSGQATWLANVGVTGPKYLGAYDKQIAIFSQVVDFDRDPGGSRELFPDNTLIFYTKKYHWAWAIPIDDEIVSIGIVVPAAYFMEKKESKRDFILREMKELNPELAGRLPPNPKLVEDVHVIPNYSYQVKNFCGKGFLCIGDAHRFIDPIFSFGLYVSMKEAGFAAKQVRGYLEGKNRDAQNPFADYQVFTEQGIDVLEDVLDCFWEHPLAFAFFVHQRYRPLMIDCFAGRIYEHQPSEAIDAFRHMLQRDRVYDNEDIYSIPIGSRFHPERAPIWEVDSPVRSTEEWMPQYGAD